MGVEDLRGPGPRSALGETRVEKDSNLALIPRIVGVASTAKLTEVPGDEAFLDSLREKTRRGMQGQVARGLSSGGVLMVTGASPYSIPRVRTLMASHSLSVRGAWSTKRKRGWLTGFSRCTQTASLPRRSRTG